MVVIACPIRFRCIELNGRLGLRRIGSSAAQRLGGIAAQTRNFTELPFADEKNLARDFYNVDCCSVLETNDKETGRCLGR